MEAILYNAAREAWATQDLPTLAQAVQHDPILAFKIMIDYMIAESKIKCEVLFGVRKVLGSVIYHKKNEMNIEYGAN